MPETLQHKDTSSAEWYVIRITHNRAKKVCDSIFALGWDDIEIYCPCLTKQVFTIYGKDIEFSQNPNFSSPILPGFVFVKATELTLKRLLAKQISGLTPYYDHFHTNEFGRNPYVIIPEREINNFRLYCEAQDTHKLIDQTDIPSYLNGKHVRIISGPFKGVEGIVLRWHSMRRVFITLANLGTFGTGFVRSCDFEVLE